MQNIAAVERYPPPRSGDASIELNPRKTQRTLPLWETRSRMASGFHFGITLPINSNTLPFSIRHTSFCREPLPGLAKSSSGVSVLWLEQHLAGFDFVRNNFARLFCDSCRVGAHLKCAASVDGEPRARALFLRGGPPGNREQCVRMREGAGGFVPTQRETRRPRPGDPQSRVRRRKFLRLPATDRNLPHCAHHFPNSAGCAFAPGVLSPPPRSDPTRLLERQALGRTCVHVEAEWGRPPGK